MSVQQRSPELQQWAFDMLVCSSVYEQQIGNKMGIKKHLLFGTATIPEDEANASTLSISSQLVMADKITTNTIEQINFPFFWSLCPSSANDCSLR